jgi:hypothetical protein
MMIKPHPSPIVHVDQASACHDRRRREVAATLPIVFGLPEIEAAIAIGVSQTKFREMVGKCLSAPLRLKAIEQELRGS